ncbi:MAG: ABC transporter permease [Longimicrobiales bacterium]
MLSVYVLTLRQLAGFRRLFMMTVLAAMPVLIAWSMVSQKHGPSVTRFETTVLSAMLAGSIAPLVVLAIAGAAFSNEIEDRTLANLFLTPIPRWKIVLPKLLATLTIAAPFMVASALATAYVAFVGDGRALFAVTVSVLVGVALYSSFFVWLGLVSPQAIGIGLLYVILWEGFLTAYISGVRLLSIRHYSIALMHGIDPRRFASLDDMGFTTAIAVSVVVFVGFLLLTVRHLRHMDVP